MSTDKTNPVERSGAVDIFYAVSKWGNSLAAHFPAAVVEPLDLKEGDEIEISIAGKRDFKFNREENERPIAGLPSSAASVLERLLRRPR